MGVRMGLSSQEEEWTCGGGGGGGILRSTADRVCVTSVSPIATQAQPPPQTRDDCLKNTSRCPSRRP